MIPEQCLWRKVYRYTRFSGFYRVLWAGFALQVSSRNAWSTLTYCKSMTEKWICWNNKDVSKIRKSVMGKWPILEKSKQVKRQKLWGMKTQEKTWYCVLLVQVRNTNQASEVFDFIFSVKAALLHIRLKRYSAKQQHFGKLTAKPASEYWGASYMGSSQLLATLVALRSALKQPR